MHLSSLIAQPTVRSQQRSSTDSVCGHRSLFPRCLLQEKMKSNTLKICFNRLSSPMLRRKTPPPPPGLCFKWCWPSAENPKLSNRLCKYVYNHVDLLWWGAIVLICTNGNLLKMISACGLFLPVHQENGDCLQLA